MTLFDTNQAGAAFSRSMGGNDSYEARRLKGPQVSKLDVVRVEPDGVREVSIPEGLSWFGPYLGHFAREVLEVGGEAYVSLEGGRVTGLYTYDGVEKTGAIYTRSRSVFDRFYRLRHFDSLFSEVGTGREGEVFVVHALDLRRRTVDHEFRHEVSVAAETDYEGVERFMARAHPGMNRAWVRVALRSGDRCVIARAGDGIAGVGWLSLVAGVGRLHSLYVAPKFRGMGIGGDILGARLLWLWSSGARMAFSEISRQNRPSSAIAARAHMTKASEVFLYSRMQGGKPSAPHLLGAPHLGQT